MQTEEKTNEDELSYKALCTVFQKIQMDTDTRSNLCVTDNGL